jgi:hypothetical protein
MSSKALSLRLISSLPHAERRGGGVLVKLWRAAEALTGEPGGPQTLVQGRGAVGVNWIFRGSFGAVVSACKLPFPGYRADLMSFLRMCVDVRKRTYPSLSKVALAITGTRWNGPRFFGLRDKPSKGIKGDSRPPTSDPYRESLGPG